MNRQLYSCWRLGKRKPAIVHDGKELVEGVGQRIEVRGLGLGWGVGVSASERASSSVVDLCDEAFREEAVGLNEGSTRYVGEGGSYMLCKGVGSGFGSGSKEMS